MNKRIDIPSELYEDEVVCFLADRYHTTPRKVVQCFLAQTGCTPDEEITLSDFRLEGSRRVDGIVQSFCANPVAAEKRTFKRRCPVERYGTPTDRRFGCIVHRARLPADGRLLWR